MLRNIIKKNIITVSPDASITDVAKIMRDNNIGSIAVTENQRPIGIITDRDIVVRCTSEHKDLSGCQVRDHMTSSPETVKDTDGIYECARRMHQAHIRRLPVVDEQGQAIGIVSFGDLLAVLSKELSDLTLAGTVVADTELKKTAA